MLKRLVWIGSSRFDLKAFPEEVQDEIGYALYQAQLGYFLDNAKPLTGFSGVFEVVEGFNRGAYRAVYATKLGNNLYVLHAFQKKSKHGIRTPKEEMILIKKRLQIAQLCTHEVNHERASISHWINQCIC